MEQSTGFNKKQYLIYAILFVIILILAAMTIAFAYFKTASISNDQTNVLASLDCINITYSEENTIDLDYNYPISDEYALTNITPVTVTVENQCTENISDVNYALVITSLANETGYISDNKIKLFANKKINAEAENTVQDTEYLSNVTKLKEGNMLTTLNADLDTRENVKDYANRASYILHEGNISNSSVHTFKVYLWVDYYEGDTTQTGKNNNSTEGQNFASAISLYVNPSYEEEYGATDSICTLASDSTVSAGEYGAKYDCKVDPNKDAYTFYLIDNNDDGTSDLIMNANINASGEAVIPGVTEDTGEVVWYADEQSNIYGPVTAMTYLYNATKSWTNVEPLNYTYNDREVQGITDTSIGYESFVSTDGIGVITAVDGTTKNTIGSTSEPLRARMPIYSSDTSVTEVADQTDANAFLYNNLDSDYDYSGPYEYWTLSSEPSYSGHAWSVGYNGNIIFDNVVNAILYNGGVRPVITVEL